jgi:alpha-galactosidase
MQRLTVRLFDKNVQPWQLFMQGFWITRCIWIKIIVLLLSSAFLPYNHAASQPIQNRLEGNPDVFRWVKEHFVKAKIPPFSFIYDGKDSRTFITSWKYNAEKQLSSDPDLEKFLYTYSDIQSGLEVKCFVTVYKDFPAVEWVLKFLNTSAHNSLLLEKTDVINHLFTCHNKGKFILHHLNGAGIEKSDFMPLDDTLETGKNIYMTPFGGRSSSKTAFPFFNIESPDKSGIMGAIGWSGNWFADIQQTGGKTVSLRSGMKEMKLRLYAGEEIRTPSVCLLFWKGENRMVGHNWFRQFVLAHHTRKIKGRPFAEAPLSLSTGRGGPAPCNEHGCLTESYAVASVERLKQFNVVPEVCWVDAGWYSGGGERWQNVGNWTPDAKRFPNGLKPVSDAIHAVGAKFLLWFEPERVSEGSPLAREHPEWMLKRPPKPGEPSEKRSLLFDLGNKAARLWLTDYISDFIKEQGIDYYRQDFNSSPEPYWNAKDRPDRVGISEIRHIEGLYAYWDTLLARFPNLIIDNCAGGGRRLDLETISRSSPLWRTDYQPGEPIGYQCQTYGLNFYLPIHGTAGFGVSPYSLRSAMSSAMVLTWDVNSASSIPSISEMQNFIKDFKHLRPYYYGDYYPLTGTKNMLQDSVWLAYQLNRENEGDGIIMAFRRKNCPVDSILVKLQGLNKIANYEFYDEDSGQRITKTGDEILRGFMLTLKKPRSSVLIEYKRMP